MTKVVPGEWTGAGLHVLGLVLDVGLEFARQMCDGEKHEDASAMPCVWN